MDDRVIPVNHKPQLLSELFGYLTRLMSVVRKCDYYRMIWDIWLLFSKWQKICQYNLRHWYWNPSRDELWHTQSRLLTCNHLERQANFVICTFIHIRSSWYFYEGNICFFFCLSSQLVKIKMLKMNTFRSTLMKYYYWAQSPMMIITYIMQATLVKYQGNMWKILPLIYLFIFIMKWTETVYLWIEEYL